MPTEQQIPEDHPLWIAWLEYTGTAEFANTRRWAMHEQHVDGSLWAAFSAGWRAQQEPTDGSA